jgi:serine/threonine protein kinase/Tfp pilus assembly protein PilF
MKCHKCNFENPDTQRFCGDCGTQFPPAEEISAPLTETLETPKEELTTGSTFAGRYQIIEELGKGGMGKVYKAQDTDLKEKVAIKLLRPEIAGDKKTIERFRNELKFARKIRHKNVCQMYDLNKETGSHYITMEYVDGKDLKGMIRMMGQLSSGKTIFIAKQICEGLVEAHRLGVVHRDLKPQNIMVDEDGNARIMDFGIARSLKTKGITAAGVMIGTPEYMSPEQVEGKEVDERSDIYSLGVILYEMVTGRVPFEGDTPFTIGVKHKSEEPKDPKELNTQLPEDLNLVILRCLEKDKEKRYQSAGEVRAELTRIEKGIPTTEIEIPRRKPLTSREITVTFGLKKLFIPAIVVAALIIAALIIWQLLPQRELAPGPKIENSIAVINFENQTGDSAYDYLQKAIPSLLITSLEQRGSLYVATWERLRDLLKQMGEDEVEFIDSDMGFSLCRREGIGAIVLGSFVKAGDLFATDVKVLDVETKKPLTSASSKGRGVDSILERQIDELSREITRSMGIREQKAGPSSVKLADITTTSMEVYDYYLKGREARSKQYNEEAREFYEKAVALDPNFAMAFLQLGQIYSRLGDIKARNHAFEKAMELSEKASEKEKLVIELSYVRYIERDNEKYLRLLLQLSEKYPKEKWIHQSLGQYYQGRDRAKALEEYNKVLELDPNYKWAYNQIGYTYIGMREYAKAIDYFKKYITVAPGEANPHDSMGDAYFRMGRIEEAIAKYREALAIRPDFYTSLRSIPYLYALKEDYSEAMSRLDRLIDIAQAPGEKREAYLCKGFYYYWLGNLEKCLENLQRSEELAEDVGDERGIATVNFLRTWIYLDRERFDLSRKSNKTCFDVNIKNYPQNEKYYKAFHSLVLGSIELKERKIDSVKKRLTEVESLLPDFTSGRKERIKYFYDLLQAEGFLAEGLPEKCIAVLEKISPPRAPGLEYADSVVFYNLPIFKDILPRAYKQKGDLDKAIAAYEKLIVFDPESKDRFLIHPVYHYRLAKLYEEKGWQGKAIEHYKKFLSLWKDADPGIAEVEDAKKRVAGLKG